MQKLAYICTVYIPLPFLDVEGVPHVLLLRDSQIFGSVVFWDIKATQFIVSDLHKTVVNILPKLLPLLPLSRVLCNLNPVVPCRQP